MSSRFLSGPHRVNSRCSTADLATVDRRAASNKYRLGFGTLAIYYHTMSLAIHDSPGHNLAKLIPELARLELAVGTGDDEAHDPRGADGRILTGLVEA
jgi:hypothetical protein